jgi:ABC-type lipoprotein release transport system permease subunit
MCTGRTSQGPEVIRRRPTVSFEWFIAWRYLRAKRKTRFISIITFISVGGVVVGVMALIVVLAVMNGFENYGDDPLMDYDRLAEEAEALPDVVAAAPFTYNKAVLQGYGGSDGAVVRGIDLALEAGVTDILENIDPPLSSLATPPGEMPGAIVGDELAKRLRVTVGDTVAISSPFDYSSAPACSSTTSRSCTSICPRRSRSSDWETASSAWPSRPLTPTWRPRPRRRW